SALMPITKSLAEANEVYYLERGEYSNAPTELNIQGQEEYPDGTSILMYDENGLSYVRATNSNVPNARYLVYQKNSENFPGTTMCEASDDPAKALCVALGGEEVPGGNSSGEDGWTAYLLTGGYGSTDSFYTQDGCRTADKPADVTASQSGATGTATCVNGQWKYQWTGGSVFNSALTTVVCGAGYPPPPAYGCAGSEYKGRENECAAQREGVCMGSTFSGLKSGCRGFAINGCAGSTFSGAQSNCQGHIANGCANSTFTGGSSYCRGNAANGCVGSTFGGDRSYCSGGVANGCSGTFIQGGAYCYAQAEGSCDGVTYQENSNGVTGCCMGNYCPAGAPKCGNWNYTTKAYDIDGTW
ncbi:MAG: hypothetical protein IJ266_01475, partial [Elusimicrobiaceae bacterium]|nr:hypothetical protein [Elusimicrobiaceae bacterium]